MNNYLKKITITILTITIILTSILVSMYYISFKPKTEVVPINTEIEINNLYLLKKFLPSNFNFSFKEVYVESNTSFSEEELTDLFILAAKEIPDISQYLSGLKVDISDNNLINIYLHLKYKDIPFEAKLTFSCKAEDGKGIFHYESGKIGFVNIPKDIIFNKTEDTSVVQFDKNTGNIILSFKTIKQLDVRNIVTDKDNINITFRGTLKFFKIFS